MNASSGTQHFKMFPIRICLHVNRSVICRRYSAKPSIGKRFTSLEQIKEYMSKETWSVDEYLSDSEASKQDLPSRETVIKLLKLSGLPIQGNDIERIQERLGKQLSFINKLHQTPIEDEAINESDARLMPRSTEALDFEGLLAKIEKTEKNIDIGEVSGSWDSTGLAKIKENGYFVVRGGLMKNRS